MESVEAQIESWNFTGGGKTTQNLKKVNRQETHKSFGCTFSPFFKEWLEMKLAQTKLLSLIIRTFLIKFH